MGLEASSDYEITFFLPTKSGMKELGGAQLLFLQVAEYIAHNFNYNVNFIDTKNGRVAARLNTEIIKLIEYNSTQQLKLNGKQVVITSLANLKNAVEVLTLNNESKLFFWNLGTTDYNNNLALMGLYSRLPLKIRKNAINILEHKTKRKLEQLMMLLINQQAVAFMSGKNFDYLNKYLTITAKPSYLPVSIADINPKQERSISSYNSILCDKNEFNIGWLGRYEKTNTILMIIESIASTETQAILHIIGWGTARERETLLHFAEQKGVKIKIVEGLYNAELNNYLTKHIDMGIAMGLSLLNFAALRIPVIATEYFANKNEIKDELTFKWFFYLKNYDLATTLAFSQDFEDMHKLGFFIDEIKNNAPKFADLCFDFYAENYRFSRIVSQLLKMALLSGLTTKILPQIKLHLRPNSFHRIMQTIKTVEN